MNIHKTLIAIVFGGFVGITPGVFAQDKSGDADDKIREQQLADKAQQMHNERLNACKKKASEQMTDGQRMKLFMQTCMEQATKDAAKK